jgi:hypothetical protein
MNEQELKAWSLAIAVLIKGGMDTLDAALAIEKYKPLADGIEIWLKGNTDQHLGRPRF